MKSQISSQRLGLLDLKSQINGRTVGSGLRPACRADLPRQRAAPKPPGIGGSAAAAEALRRRVDFSVPRSLHLPQKLSRLRRPMAGYGGLWRAIMGGSGMLITPVFFPVGDEVTRLHLNPKSETSPVGGEVTRLHSHRNPESSPVGDDVTRLHLNPKSETSPVGDEVTRLHSPRLAWAVNFKLPGSHQFAAVHDPSTQYTIHSLGCVDCRAQLDRHARTPARTPGMNPGIPISGRLSGEKAK